VSLVNFDVYRYSRSKEFRGFISNTGSQLRLTEFISLIGMLCLMLLVITASGVQADSLEEAAERYRIYLIKDMDQVLAGARALHDRIAAKDLDGAKKAWIDARAAWERSEVFTGGFVPDLDNAIDAWPEAVTGFHGIEAKLFGANRLDVQEEADALVLQVAAARRQAHDIRLIPQGLLNGISRLAHEMGESKVDGGESRFSGTSLADMRNNADGIELAYQTVFAAALEARDPRLAQAAVGEIRDIKMALDVPDLRGGDPNQLRKVSEELVVTPENAGPKIGLSKPALEETSR